MAMPITLGATPLKREQIVIYQTENRRLKGRLEGCEVLSTKPTAIAKGPWLVKEHF